MRGDLDNLRVVLVATRNPLNIGAAARAMSNFGARHLRLVTPYEVAFREARSAVGAAELMSSAREYGTVADAVADCTLVVGTTAAGRRELQHELQRLEQGGRTIRRQLGAGRVALLFGSEKVGLSNEGMSHCHWLMRIPTRAGHGSMNLGQAVAICLYELVRLGKIPTAKNGKTVANAADLERLTQVLFELLDASGYVKPRVATATEEKLRRMMRRMNLSSADAGLWLGMLRQIRWKLGAREFDAEPNED
ncbi:MAG: TrmJ/YjtD family RNA methyltransferase [Terriglobales bacterium]|jgi:TrmH family RNA methyltransferase